MSLPHGTTVRLDPRLLTADGGRLLVGGSPLTAMRLPPSALAVIDGGTLTISDPATATLARRLLAANLASPDLVALPPLAQHELTVVVPVRDRAPQLDRCLAGLAGLAVVVVDDGSHDPAAVAAVVRRHGASLVPLTVNVGPAAARNAGLAQVTTPAVAFVDSDVEVTTQALLDLGGHLVDPQVALVGPRVEGRTRSPRTRWFERYDACVSSLTLGHRPSSVRPGAAVAWLPSACLVGRRNLLGHGFTEAMRVGEDVDLVWRLVEADHVVRYEPAVIAHHDVRATVRGWLGRKVLYGSGGAALAQRHGDRVAPAVLSLPMAIGGAAVLARRRWSAPVVAAVLIHAARGVHRALPAGVPARERALVAARIAARGTGWAVRQESALVLRHWWPPALALCVSSRLGRRVLVTALVVDGAVGLHEHLGTSTCGPVTLLLGRRLEDLAYGLGLWAGAVRARSARCLGVRRPSRLAWCPNPPHRRWRRTADPRP